jgi:hypothetical protein
MPLANPRESRDDRRDHVSVNPVFTREPLEIPRLRTPPAELDAEILADLWRDAAALPDHLVFRVNYLGGEMPTFALSFSRPGAQVAAQYYSFLRLVPAYSFPANRKDLAVLRVVVRNGFTHDLADLFRADLEACLPRLRAQHEPVRGAEDASFAHGARPRHA